LGEEQGVQGQAVLVDGTPPLSLYGKERERFRERSDLQDAAAAAFRKREIRRLNLPIMFSPTLRGESRTERSGVYTYIPNRLSF